MTSLTSENSNYYLVKYETIKYPGLPAGYGDYNNNIFYHDEKYYVLFYSFDGFYTYGWGTGIFNIEIWESDLKTEDSTFSLNMQYEFELSDSQTGPDYYGDYRFSDDIYLNLSLDKDGILHLILNDMDYGKWVRYIQLEKNEDGIYEFSGGCDITSYMTDVGTVSKPVVLTDENIKYLAFVYEDYSENTFFYVFEINGTNLVQIQSSMLETLEDFEINTWAVSLDYDHNGDGITLNSTDIYITWGIYNRDSDTSFIHYTKATKNGNTWSIGEIIEINPGDRIDFYNWGMTDFFSFWTGSNFIITAMMQDYLTDYVYGFIFKINNELQYTSYTVPYTPANYNAVEPFTFRLLPSHKKATIYPVLEIGHYGEEDYYVNQYVPEAKLDTEEITWSDIDLNNPLTGSFYGDLGFLPIEITTVIRHIGSKFCAAGVEYIWYAGY